MSRFRDDLTDTYPNDATVSSSLTSLGNVEVNDSTIDVIEITAEPSRVSIGEDWNEPLEAKANAGGDRSINTPNLFADFLKLFVDLTTDETEQRSKKLLENSENNQPNIVERVTNSDNLPASYASREASESTDLIVPSLQLNRKYSIGVSETTDAEYHQLVEQIHLLLSNETRDPEVVKKVSQLYVQANRLAPHDFRLDLLISLGFEFQKKRIEADQAVKLSIKKLQLLKEVEHSPGSRPNGLDLDLQFKPRIQQIRLSMRDTSTKSLNRIVYDCDRLINDLKTEFVPTKDLESAKDIARFVACVFQKIELENDSSNSIKVNNIEDYGLRIAQSLKKIDPALERSYSDCRLALQGDPDGQRLEFISTLNYFVEMASIVRSYEY